MTFHISFWSNFISKGILKMLNIFFNIMISTFIFLFLIARGFSDVPCNDLYCIGCMNNICSLCINGYSLGVDQCESKHPPIR
jgi:hypothetical protein